LKRLNEKEKGFKPADEEKDPAHERGTAEKGRTDYKIHKRGLSNASSQRAHDEKGQGKRASSEKKPYLMKIREGEV